MNAYQESIASINFAADKRLRRENWHRWVAKVYPDRSSAMRTFLDIWPTLSKQRQQEILERLRR